MDEDAFESAAKRQKASVKPEGGRTEGVATYLTENYLPHVVKGLMGLPQRTTEAAGSLQRGGSYDPGPALETAMVMAGARSPFVKQGDLGVFGGVGARTADRAKLAKAKEMEADFVADQISKQKRLFGSELDPALVKTWASPAPLGPGVQGGGSPIFNETGWFRGRDGKWRFEIQDKNAKLTPEGDRLSKEERIAINPNDQPSGTTLSKYLEHPELYEAYPHLKDTRVIARALGGMKGEYSPLWKDIKLEATLGPHQKRSTLLHEVQHGIQEGEDFARGTSPFGVAHEIAKKVPIDKPWGVDLIELYKRYAGETESRNVQRRAYGGLEEYHPRLTEDRPWRQQIVPWESYGYRQEPEIQDILRALAEQK